MFPSEFFEALTSLVWVNIQSGPNWTDTNSTIRAFVATVIVFNSNLQALPENRFVGILIIFLTNKYFQ